MPLSNVGFSWGDAQLSFSLRTSQRLHTQASDREDFGPVEAPPWSSA